MKVLIFVPVMLVLTALRCIGYAYAVGFTGLLLNAQAAAE
jgi:hypothetical protein